MRGHRRRQHDRGGETGAERDKDRQRLARRGEHRIAERRAHERRRAWGRDDRRQDAGRKRAGKPGPLGEAAADAAQPDAEFDDPGQAQPHREQEIGEQRDDNRRLQLEAPADRVAAGPQYQQQPAERGEAHDHARGVGETVAALLGAVHRDRDPQQLQRQDREDARHQVQDRAADKRQQQRLPPPGNERSPHRQPALGRRPPAVTGALIA